MSRLIVLFSLGLLASFVAGEFGALNKTLIPARVARSVSLTLLDAKDTTAVLQLAKPGIDYPIWDVAPKTHFSCAANGIEIGRRYADPETGCQVFRICDAQGIDTAYLCPNKTIFNDQSQVCEWFHQVKCDLAFKPTNAIVTVQQVAAPIVVDAKPTCVTTCTQTAAAAQSVAVPVVVPVVVAAPVVTTVQQQLPNPIAQEILSRPREVLAPVVGISTVPVLPITDKVIATAAAPANTVIQNAPTRVVNVPAGIISTQQIPTANTATLGTGILSNLQTTSSGWGSAIQAPKVLAAAPIVASGWGSQRTQQLAAPVAVNSGWGSGQQQMSGYSGQNPGMASANNMFGPLAGLYGNGIMNHFVTPFMGFPFAGAFGFMG